MAEPAKKKGVPEFKFDFEKLQGLDFEEAMVAAYHQLEDHYNKWIKPAPILFGGKPFTAPALAQPMNPAPGATGPTPPPADRPKVIDPDKETVTPKTIPMAKFVMLPVSGGIVLKGTSDDGKEIEDQLLPGYDEKPYGPVVTGEHGRYNLKVVSNA